MKVLALLFALTAGVIVSDEQVRLRMVANDPVIPLNRLTDWTPGYNVGVPSGVPPNGANALNTRVCDALVAACDAVTNAAAGYSDGTLDAKALLQAAITAIPADFYLQLKCGTYRVDSALDVAHTDDGIAIRGCKDGVTIIDCNFTGAYCIRIGSTSDLSWLSPASGNTVTAYSDNGATLTMADTSAFGSAGQLLRFAVSDDPAVPIFSVHGWPDRRTQVTKLVSKTSTTLTVFPPIRDYSALTGLTARVNRASQQADNVGLQDLVIDGDNGTIPDGVQLLQTTSAYLYNVTVTHFTAFVVNIQSSIQCEVRHSKITEGGTGGANGTGLILSTVDGCLIEDNILTEVQAALTLKDGSSGNVIAYNFMHNSNGTITTDTNHGPLNTFNLYEGNITTNLISDGYYGGEVYGTAFRNYLHGNGETGFGTLSDYCFQLKRFTRSFTAVGNIYGGTLFSSNCWTYGEPNIGNHSSSGTAQPSQGDYWTDWTLSGTTITGTLTTRTSDTVGQITLSSGTLTTGNDQIALWTAASTVAPCCLSNVSAVAGSVISFTNIIGVLPAVSTAITVWAGPEGFQEIDLDVEATLVSKTNWDANAGTMLGGTSVLPLSLFRVGKPSYFGAIAWPPITPTSPSTSWTVIPAGYRFVNGSDPVDVGTFTMDMIVNFSAGTPGNLLTVADIDSGTHGSLGGGSWSEPGTAAAHTFIEDHAVTFPGLISVGGTDYDGSEGQGISFDLTAEVSVQDIFQRPLNSGITVTNAQNVYLINYEANHVSGSYNNDTMSFNGTNFSIAQMGNSFASIRTLYAHSSGNLGRTITAPFGWLVVSVRHNVDDQRAQVLVQDATTMRVLGTSSAEYLTAGGALIYTRIQSYLRNAAADLEGKYKIKLIAYSDSSTWPPYPVYPPEPIAPRVSQTADDELTITWASTCQEFVIERNVNGAGWTTLVANHHENGNSYVDTTLSNGQSVQYRITTVIGGYTSSAVTSNTVVVSN